MEELDARKRPALDPVRAAQRVPRPWCKSVLDRPVLADCCNRFVVLVLDVHGALVCHGCGRLAVILGAVYVRVPVCCVFQHCGIFRTLSYKDGITSSISSFYCSAMPKKRKAVNGGASRDARKQQCVETPPQYASFCAHIVRALSNGHTMSADAERDDYCAHIVRALEMGLHVHPESLCTDNPAMMRAINISAPLSMVSALKSVRYKDVMTVTDDTHRHHHPALRSQNKRSLSVFPDSTLSVESAVTEPTPSDDVPDGFDSDQCVSTDESCMAPSTRAMTRALLSTVTTIDGDNLFSISPCIDRVALCMELARMFVHTGAMSRNNKYDVRIPISSKVHEDAQLCSGRDPRIPQCVSGMSCAVMDLAQHAQPLQAYLLPHMQAEFDNNRHMELPYPALCLLCIRRDWRIILDCVLKLLKSGTIGTQRPSVCAPPFQNIAGPGNYTEAAFGPTNKEQCAAIGVFTQIVCISAPLTVKTRMNAANKVIQYVCQDSIAFTTSNQDHFLPLSETTESTTL